MGGATVNDRRHQHRSRLLRTLRNVFVTQRAMPLFVGIDQIQVKFEQGRAELVIHPRSTLAGRV